MPSDKELLIRAYGGFMHPDAVWAERPQVLDSTMGNDQIPAPIEIGSHKSRQIGPFVKRWHSSLSIN
jgi:hypothetical protein